MTITPDTLLALAIVFHVLAGCTYIILSVRGYFKWNSHIKQAKLIVQQGKIIFDGILNCGPTETERVDLYKK